MAIPKVVTLETFIAAAATDAKYRSGIIQAEPSEVNSGREGKVFSMRLSYFGQKPATFTHTADFDAEDTKEQTDNDVIEYIKAELAKHNVNVEQKERTLTLTRQERKTSLPPMNRTFYTGEAAQILGVAESKVAAHGKEFSASDLFSLARNFGKDQATIKQNLFTYVANHA